MWDRGMEKNWKRFHHRWSLSLNGCPDKMKPVPIKALYQE
jgi:hypothetical protein